MSQSFIADLENGFIMEPKNSVMNTAFSQFERIIIESLVTSFGLDSLIKDQHGGDVDTINNARLIGKDHEMHWKSKENEKAYKNNPEYSSKDYHRNTDNNYNNTKHDARVAYRENGQTVTDAYTGEEIGFLGKSKGADSTKNAELDHVIAAKKIHEDPGRVLSGLDGEKLAHDEENLAWTNKSLNASMGAMDIDEYIAVHPEMPEAQKQRMLKVHNKAKKAYEHKLFVAYYTSPQFLKNTAKATGITSTKMGFRQALGFVAAEIIFSVIEGIKGLPNGFKLGDAFNEIISRIKIGVERAKNKFKEIFTKFKDGLLAGALASLTTTLTNIFIATAKNVVKIIRQTWASVVEAIKIFLFNPDGLLVGDRILAGIKVLALGASVVVGTMVSELISKSPVGEIPYCGDIISTFCGTFATGILSCCLLYFLDRSEIATKVCTFLNQLPSIDKVTNFYRTQAAKFEEYAASLMSIDLEIFRKETAIYNQLAESIDINLSSTALLHKLDAIYEIKGLEKPYKGNFKSFMANSSNRLLFK